MTVSEANSKTGNFTFDPPRAKIVWVNIPAESEFVVKFKLNTGSVTGPGVFNQKLYYVDDGKKEFEAEPLNVNIDASGATTTTSFPETSSVASNSVTSSSSGGGETGSSAGSNTVASSGSSGNSGSTGESTSGTSSATLASSGSSGNGGSGGGEIKKENTSGSASSGGSTGKTVREPATSGSSGLVYKIQLGAYGADPGKSKFSKAGKVTISKEDGFYKVITGNYNTKEEALQASEALRSKGFSGFIVKYQNGVRVK
jgi:hypothetical protein